MSYIGNTPTTQAFIPAIDYFSGNGSTVAFTLSRQVASVAQVQAVIENVPQSPGTAFTVSGNVITFTSAPPSGTNNIYVYYTSPITQVIAPSDGTVGTSALATGAVTNDKLTLTANASNIMTALNASGTAPIYACRAWVNFNGTGTVAIRASGNVSSITDNGTGDYTVNFTNAMAGANYAACGLCRISGNNLNNMSLSSAVTPTTSAIRFITNQATLFDADYVYSAIFS